ncbi:MAG: LUD domain-containing protein [Actinomycetaceae bacterium]|nr:LUD domain-containing protein [Actinomycetaceae bacterium]
MNRQDKDRQAKAEILRRVRVALNDNPIEEIDVPRDYIREGKDAPGSDPVIDVFVDALEDYKAHVVVVEADEIPASVAAALSACSSVVIPHGLNRAWLSEIDGVDIRVDEPDALLSNHDLDATDAVITASRCAVSHTGMIVLDGEPDQGRRAISLVPDTHVCIVEAKTVFPTVPQAVSLLAENPTRPMTWIAGPSATSDIELIRVDGVHGPRNLHVIVVR